MPSRTVYLAVVAALNIGFGCLTQQAARQMAFALDSMLDSKPLPTLTVISFSLPPIFYVLSALAGFGCIGSITQKLLSTTLLHGLTVILLLDALLLFAILWGVVLPFFFITYRLQAH